MGQTIVEQSEASSAAPFSVIEAEIKTGRLAVLNLKTPPLYSRAGIMHFSPSATGLNRVASRRSRASSSRPNPRGELAGF